jgi:hypothetical protein
MSVEVAERRFWETLSQLLRYDDDSHNRRFIKHLSEVSKIPEPTVCLKLAQAVRTRSMQ